MNQYGFILKRCPSCKEIHNFTCLTLALKVLLLLLQIVPRPAEGAATTGLIERQRVYKSCPFLKDKST